MTWMNKNARQFMITGIILVAFVFVLPFIWPVDKDWYFRNLSWMIPLAIGVFIAPIVSFILSNWDIHFDFQEISVSGSNLVVIVSNLGNSPFAFNRLQFSSGKKYGIVGKRELYPESDQDSVKVSLSGAETPYESLNKVTGFTLKKGLPIALTIGRHQYSEHLRHFKGNSKIYLSLYYEGTKQRVYSQRIPPEIVINMTQSSNQG